MQDNEVRFRCGQKVFIEMVFGRVSYASARASSGTLEISKSIIKKVIENDHARAEAYLEEAVLLVDPPVVIDDDGSCCVPPYWCAAKLWTIAQNRQYRYCSVMWYQDQLAPDISGIFSDWAAGIDWTSAVDSLPTDLGNLAAQT